MSYKYYKETTNYTDTDYEVPLHTYIFDNSKCVGYIKAGTNERIFFKKPSVHFNKRGRTFKEVKYG
jgi:hypothetical protein